RARLQQMMDRWDARLKDQAAELRAAEQETRQRRGQRGFGQPGRGQRGAVDISALEAVVDGAIKAGKWTAEATQSAAQWLSETIDRATANIAKARMALVQRFGQGIRRFVG